MEKKTIPSMHPRTSWKRKLENLRCNKKSANLTQTTQLIDPSSSESKLCCHGLQSDTILAMKLSNCLISVKTG